jgi:large subunit ribosomal protein L4
MATLKKYDLAGKEIGEVKVEDKLLEVQAHTQSIKDYLVAIRNNARQWNAHTKTRAEVNHSGQKPHPQKGTGRARQGYLGSPQYKGGGRVGGPRHKVDQHVSINRKEKRAAIRFLLAEKIQNNQIVVLQQAEMKEPKTKKVAQFLQSCGLSKKRILVLGDKTDEMFFKSMRNIPKTEFLLMANASGYDLVASQNLIVLEPAVEQLLKILEG